MINLDLPVWPPSTNSIWRNVHGRTVLAAPARSFFVRAVDYIGLKYPQAEPLRGSVAVTIRLYPPDRRKFDIDNRCKALLDTLSKAGIFEDDSQVDRLTVSREAPEKGGRVEVDICPLPAKM